MTAALRSSSVEAIGTTALVAVTEPKVLPEARRIMLRELDAIDRACSRFRSDSELTCLNRASGAAQPVSELLFEALRVAVRAADITGGLVTPTVGRTLRLAGYDTTFSLVSRRNGRSFEPRFSRVPDWRGIELDDARRTVRAPAGTELDLGATAKALAADRTALAVTRELACGALVSLGGDIAVAGRAPGGGWPIRLADSHADPLDGPGPTVAVASGGLATSSTTARRWNAGGVDLHHVVDPRTGRPAETPWRTVTVAAGSCVDANTASTAALVLGDEAARWLDERRLPTRLVAGDGTAVCVGGWREEAAA